MSLLISLHTLLASLALVTVTGTGGPLAAYYSVYNRPAAVNDTLFHFRKAYPHGHARVHVVNNNGDRKLARLAHHYKVKYLYSDMHDRPDDYSPSGVITTLERMFQALGNADWLLLLGDNVRVLQPVQLDTLQYDINGDNKNTALIDKIMNYLRSAGSDVPDAHYGGSGGSVLRGSFLRKIRHEQWHDQVWLIYKAADTDALAFSVILSALFRLNNGTIGPYDGYAEMWYQDREQRIAEGKVAVVHGDESLYNAEFAYDAL